MKRRIFFIVLCFCILAVSCPRIKITAEIAESRYETFYFEAEDILTDAAKTYENFHILEDSSASGGKTVFVDKVHIKETYPDATMTIHAAESGVYNIFARVKGNDAFSVSVNGSGVKTYYMKLSESEYQWQYFAAVTLNSGVNTIDIQGYKWGLYLDKIIVTNNILYMPTGMGTAAQTETGLLVYGEQPFPKKNEHPRLFFGSSDIERIKGNLEHPENSEQYAKMQEDAQYETDGTFQKNMSYAVDNKVAAYIESNAFLYALNRTMENGKNAVNALFKYLETVAPGSEVDRVYDNAGFLAAEVYDWCYDLLQEEQKTQLIEQVMKIFAKTEYGFPTEKASAYIEGHQYEQKMQKDLLAFSIAIYDEKPDLYNYTAGRLLHEYVPVLNHHYENSSFHSQGDDYGSTRYPYSLFMSILFESIGVETGISSSQRDMAYQFLYRKRPDGRSMGDGDRWTQNSINEYNTAVPVFLAANLYHDGYLKSAFLNNAAEYQNIKTAYYTVTPVLHLILNDTALQPGNVSELPLSRYMGKESGMMTARTGWDENAMIVSMKMPERYFMGHSHLDAGNFEIYYKGALAIDSGVYNGKNGAFGSEHDNNYNKRTIAHNCMLIYDPNETGFGIGTANDGGQRVEKILSFQTASLADFKSCNQRGEVLAYGYGQNMDLPDYTYLKGDITNAYSPDKVEDYHRTFLFLNLESSTSPGVLMVLDKVTSTDADFQKTWLLHTKNQPQINGNTSIASLANGVTLKNQTLLPQDASYTSVEGFWVDGTNYDAEISSDDKTYDESGKWRLEITPQSSHTTDYFLNVLSVSETGEAVSLESELIDTELYYGVKIENKIAFFSKNKEKITAENIDISFSDEDPDKEYQVLLTDLDQGKWLVTDKITGKTVSVRIADETSGVISFNAKPGSYSIVRQKNHTIVTSEEVFSECSKQELKIGDTVIKANVPYAVFVSSIEEKDSSIFDYGILFSKSVKEPELNKANVIRVSAKSKNIWGSFGVLLYDIDLKNSYYIRPYVIWSDNHVAYGDIKQFRFDKKLN